MYLSFQKCFNLVSVVMCIIVLYQLFEIADCLQFSALDFDICPDAVSVVVHRLSIFCIVFRKMQVGGCPAKSAD